MQQSHSCQEKSLWEIGQDSVEFLRHKGLISVSTDCEKNTVLLVTSLGRATFKGEGCPAQTPSAWKGFQPWWIRWSVSQQFK